MPALFFPNLTALRLALASGLVPVEISRAPAAAWFDAHNRLWLELHKLPPRDSLAALARVGVQVLGGTGAATERVNCWAELLPLNRSAHSLSGPVLFVVPDRGLAKFLARLRRSTTAPSGISLQSHESEQRGWVTVSNPPSILLAELDEPDAVVEAFTEQAPGIWALHGWRHPLPDQLVRQPGTLLLIRPPRAFAIVPGEVPVPGLDEFALPAARSRSSATSPRPPSVPVRLSLTPRRSAERESLWIFDPAQASEFWSFCAAADERLSRRLEVGRVTCGTETRLVVRASGKRLPVILSFPVRGYAADPRVPGLYVPVDRVLRPVLRVRELTRALRLAPDHLVWVEAGVDGVVVPHAVPMSLFRPVADLIDYTAPGLVALSVRRQSEAFPLGKFALPNDGVPGLEPERAPATPRDPELKEPDFEPEPSPNESGWFRRSLRKLASRLRDRLEPSARIPPPVGQPQPDPSPSGQHVERKLASRDALVHGHDWTARRRELEARLFRELPELGPEGRAARWADLAVVYATTGNPADAAVCWMNGVWESPNPSMEWLEQWFAAECRAARVSEHTGGLERWLSEPGRPGVGRVVAAYTARAGFAPNPPPEFPAALPRILAFLDNHFDDLPVRAAWLARLAATRLCDGDALGLARWRDRVLARLADRGPGLDLDEPSFLRFHGTASADRFQTAREWLVRVREPVIKWIQRHVGGRLTFHGLDAEIESTTEYAKFMLAWGLGCLGERTLAKDWAARARKALSRATARGVDPAVPSLLGDLFLRRVKDAQEGRAPKPGLPPEHQARVEALHYLSRYAVNRIRKHSRILEPIDRVQSFGGLDLKVFWGNDRLGERLYVLAGGGNVAHLEEEADELLRFCATSPTTDTVPRVVFTLFEVAPRLEPATILRLVDLLPTAVDWVEAWIVQGEWTNDERPRRLTHYMSRMIEAAFDVAGSMPTSTIGPAVSQLTRRLLSIGESMRNPLLKVTGSVFRCLRRLALAGEAEDLMRFLDPGELGTMEGAELAPSTRLGLGIGWLTAGNEDAGNRILDEARERLYLASDAELPDRTELAIAYAEALGFAPPPIAHGRLEEIFWRLRPIKVEGGTNRYLTLKPLQLLDTVVRSVVTDEFTLGPAVRGWLDDDEFLIRGRVHRDLTAILHDQGIG